MDTKVFLDNLISEAQPSIVSSVPVIAIDDQSKFADTLSYFTDNGVLHTVEGSSSVRFKHSGQDYYLAFLGNPIDVTAAEVAPEPIQNDTPAAEGAPKPKAKKSNPSS